VVSLPNVAAQPGTLITVPITVSDMTGRGIISYDLQVTFNPAVIQPASPEFDITGTLSSGMSITPNANNAGHLIISAFQATDLAGAGTLINLKFNVVGSLGQSTTLVFADYTDPGNTFHPGFQFNEGDPPAFTTNGSVTLGGTPTNTPTFTPTNTPTVTPTGTPGLYANAASICTNLGAPADLYPSNIVVAGGPSQVDGLRVTLLGVTHLMPDNMDFLLVGPNGAKFILMADAGGAIPVSTPGVNLIFSDTAGQVVPDSGPLTTGLNRPVGSPDRQASRRRRLRHLTTNPAALSAERERRL